MITVDHSSKYPFGRGSKLGTPGEHTNNEQTSWWDVHLPNFSARGFDP